MERDSETYKTISKDQMCMRASESQKKRKRLGWKKIFHEMMSENSPNSVKDMTQWIQEAHQTSNRLNSKKPHPDISWFHYPKSNIKSNLKSRPKTDTLHGEKWRYGDYKFLISHQACRREWNHMFQIPKGNNCHPRMRYSVKVYFRNKGKIKTF